MNSLRSGIILILIFLSSITLGADKPYFQIEFDKPFYVSGDLIFFSVVDTATYDHKQWPQREIIHIELVSPSNRRIDRSKLLMEHRVANGSILLPNNISSGYYRLRVFTRYDLRNEGCYYYADIPVYSEWKDDLAVLRDETFGEKADKDFDIVDRSRQEYSRREIATVSAPEFKWDSDADSDSVQFTFYITSADFEKFPRIKTKFKFTSQSYAPLSTREDTLLLEATLTDPISTEKVTSPLISIFSGNQKRFYRSQANGGRIVLFIPDFAGESVLQFFNLNPYQSSVNNLKVDQLEIRDTYFNQTIPPTTKEVADYLVKSQQLRKIRDLFDIQSQGRPSILLDTTQIVPDAVYLTEEYRYITTLRDFVFEAIPAARLINREDGSETVRLYNPERRSNFVDKPWYLVDGYLTDKEQEVLDIPFADILEIKLYVDTRTIKKYFEYFMWRNGIIEIRTKDIKYLRSLKTDPNFADFDGLSPPVDFNNLIHQTQENIPDLRGTQYWKSEMGSSMGWSVSFPVSDETGKFRYQVIAISKNGEMRRASGILEVTN